MHVERLELVDFRNYERAEFTLTPHTTAVIGRNGQGKTNFVEGLAYLSLLGSFRGAPAEALVRSGAEQAVIRATIRQADGREALVEAELNRNGRNRFLVNRQRLQRSRDALGALRVSVFSPDDLSLVKDGASERRRFLDDTLVTLAAKNDALRLDYERALKQRNALLKQCGGRPDAGALATLDVWDARMAELGERIGYARATLVARLGPVVSDAYGRLAGGQHRVELVYAPVWRSVGLAAALVSSRAEDLRRQLSSVGPHRDELDLGINALPARTHASQGEQRTLALALRLGAHQLVCDVVNDVPVLVLDDVLSELDDDRASALLASLPAGQVVITTAGTLPSQAAPERILRIDSGKIAES
jgi:DNA replication and repair protein RecF